MAVAKEVFSKVVTIATKILWAIEQIIASLYIYIFFNQISSIEDMQSADLVVFAINVLYAIYAVFYVFRNQSSQTGQKPLTTIDTRLPS